MNRFTLSSNALASLIFVATVVGCGGIAVLDDGTGGAGASAGTGNPTSGKTSTGKGPASNASNVASVGPGQSGVVASTGNQVASTGFASVVVASTAVVVTTGSGQLLPCEEACDGDPGCNSETPFPGSECTQCVFSEAMNIGSSSCALNAAFSPQCQADAECTEFLNCILGGGSIQGCAGMNPNGVQTLFTQVFAACGRCGQCPTCSECCVTGN